MQEKFNQNNQINSSDTPERFSQPSQSRFSRPKGNGKKQVPTWLGVLIIALAAVLIFGGVFAYQQYISKTQTPTPNAQPNLNEQTQTSEPTPSETEGWKTYKNTDYGFEFKYPEDFIIYNAISNPLIKDIISFKDNKSLSCGIWSFPADDKDYSREKLTTDKKYERLEVNNVEIFKSAIKKELGGGKGLQMFLFSKNGEEFNLACHISDNAFNEGLSAFNQILSTFRFINSTNQTAGWKTYTNTQHGFEFKYPSDWQAWEANSYLGLVILYPNSKSDQVFNKTISITDEIIFQPVDNKYIQGETQKVDVDGMTWFNRIMPDKPIDGGTEKGLEYFTSMSNNQSMDASTGVSNKETLLKILSTFKLTQ